MRNIGVRLESGDAREISVTLYAFRRRIVAVTLIVPEIISALKKSHQTTGTPVWKTNGARIITEKRELQKPILYSSKFHKFILLTISWRDFVIAQKKEKRTPIRNKGKRKEDKFYQSIV